MFLHGGLMHLGGNMWFLWVFGNNIEDRLGHVLFGAFYILGGIFATIAHYLVQPSSTVPVVGASGAIAAIMGAYAVWFPDAPVRTLIFYFRSSPGRTAALRGWLTSAASSLVRWSAWRSARPDSANGRSTGRQNPWNGT